MSFARCRTNVLNLVLQRMRLHNSFLVDTMGPARHQTLLEEAARERHSRGAAIPTARLSWSLFYTRVLRTMYRIRGASVPVSRVSATLDHYVSPPPSRGATA